MTREQKQSVKWKQTHLLRTLKTNYFHPNMTAPKTVTSESEMFDVFQMKLNLKTNKPPEDSALGLFQRHTCWTKSNPLQFHSVD